MPKKYVDVEMLIGELDAACMPIFEKGISGDLGDKNSIADIINAQPAADVQKVRHGKWVKSTEHIILASGDEKDWTNFYCSECDSPFSNPSNYCPHCGARMDGDPNA